MNIHSIGSGIGNFAVAAYNGAAQLTEIVGRVALENLSKLSWIGGESASKFIASTLGNWAHLAVGGITVLGGAVLLTGIGLLVKNYVIPYFSSAEA